MGHVFSDMEIWDAQLLHCLRCCVSIGPRLFRHGNIAAIEDPTERFQKFQLGHVFSDMEIDPFLQQVNDSGVVFQLGHVFSDMEISFLTSYLRQPTVRFNWATSFQTWK